MRSAQRCTVAINLSTTHQQKQKDKAFDYLPFWHLCRFELFGTVNNSTDIPHPHKISVYLSETECHHGGR